MFMGVNGAGSVGPPTAQGTTGMGSTVPSPSGAVIPCIVKMGHSMPSVAREMHIASLLRSVLQRLAQRVHY